MTRNFTLDAALAEAKQLYADANPRSAAQHEAARAALPGGNTRTILHYDPFPLAFARGEDASLWDLDGHRYTDFLGEYSAGLAGHSHPAIRAAITAALDGGINLGGHTPFEPRFAEAVQARFPAMEKLRFVNSGTEANLLALSAAVAATGRRRVMAFGGGYHGGVFMFSAPVNINAPFDWVIAPYNDTEATLGLIAEHAETLAAVILEPMQGGGGCIPADPDFLSALREATARHGIVLILDEVMTSRLAPGGLGAARGITPDLMTLGKYVGGGMSFGAFGGRAEIMRLFDPTQPGALPHAGTFNNNVLTMAAGHASLTEVVTPAALAEVNARGDRLRGRINALARSAGAPLQATGIGSMLAFHMTAEPVRSPADAGRGSIPARDLLFFDLLRDGFWLARRGMMTLSLPLTDADCDGLVAAVSRFLETRGALLA